MGLGSRVQARLPFRSGAMTKYPYDIGRITDETLEQLARTQFPTQRRRIPGLAEALPGSRYRLASPVERVAGCDPPPVRRQTRCSTLDRPSAPAICRWLRRRSIFFLRMTGASSSAAVAVDRARLSG